MSQSRFYEYLKSADSSQLELLICEDAKEANELADVCHYFKRDVVVFPDFRAAYLDDLLPFKEELYALFAALRHYYNAATKPLVIAPIKSVLFPLPKPELLNSITLSYADTIELKSFKEQMLHWGYTFVDIIQVEGEVSFRGDIIDIFVPHTQNPYRISLFDEDIEEIKEFSVETQRTLETSHDTIAIHSALYSLDAKEYDVLIEAIEHSGSDAFIKDVASLGFWYLNEGATSFLEGKKRRFSKNLDAIVEEVYLLNRPQIKEEDLVCDALLEPKVYGDLVVSDVPTLLKVHANKEITIIASNNAQLKQAGIFESENINVVTSPIILNIISDSEVIISLNREVKKRRRRKTTILLDDLKRGDYVVHEDYGVGVFEAIEQAEILGGVKDFLVIRYQGDDKVLLPVENLDYIDRYIASAGSLPTLDRLGKGSFGKLKDKVKARLFEIAADIVNTAAARALIKAPKFTLDAKKIKAFQADAGFEYTQDQATSIQQILQNVSSGHIMDRLLSGDVGFGKTEVAMNAIYAAAISGYQSVMVVPTTLLSSQHFKSLQERLEVYDIRINKLDRFVSPKEKKAVLASLKDGSCDVVIGTHALFGAEFKNLGLVIIDEEHKFGVKQKETLKSMHEKVHLLSMSATPIPRSLNQAMSSVKSMSTLMTPPSERQGVRTFVKAYEDKLMKEVILRELRRGGQIFYVHNSIDHMPIKEGQLKALLPNLRILVLHSKISAVTTEKELLKFQAGEYDLMLATSIIESGIHMPRVNTMIIDGADRFGIADLHQLRGRVGRGNQEGFAYFMVNDKERLTDEAKKRLLALESNSFLGSGSVLAMHDLEIRGGGNLVGDAQSGHIKNIGYSLYLRMLEDAIKELSNQKENQKHKVDIKLTISAYISETVVSEDRLRLELYRRLSQCEDPTEIYELEEECIDRFGKLDTSTKQFFELMVIKMLALDKQIRSISNYGQNITITYQNETKESIKSDSKDDDDIIKATLFYLRNAKQKVL